MNAACWTELLEKERKWTAKDMRENREIRSASSSSHRRIHKKKPHASLPKVPSAPTLESYIGPPPQRMVPVTDGSVAPKPEKATRGYGANYVFSVSNPKLPFSIWPQDVSHRKLKPAEQAALDSAKKAMSQTAPSAFVVPPPQEPSYPASPTLTSNFRPKNTLSANPSATGSFKMMWAHDMKW
eukprot:TRINITY_DN27353_c0_g1_i1.p1 TRINITY_DN27353_c0_g1~~TRINITY_DN27353_c0_g1_i1.p1  ORF type:complete len:210 (-),score=21.43 TRINITY_DN27353_c0_g1_i1:214-762(-)